MQPVYTCMGCMEEFGPLGVVPVLPSGLSLCPRCRAQLAAYPALVQVARAARWYTIVRDNGPSYSMRAAVLKARRELDAALAALADDVREEVEGREG